MIISTVGTTEKQACGDRGHDVEEAGIQQLWSLEVQLRCYKKAKCCDVCQYFQWYMASVGVCTAQGGCPANRMKDVMDTCDCGKFKFKKVKLGD